MLMMPSLLIFLKDWNHSSIDIFADAFISNNNNNGNGGINGVFFKVQSDFESLTKRATARHIVVPSEEVASVLKRKIRNECIEKESFVVDVFEKAAEKYSRDELSNFRGGLLGELVPLGHSSRISPDLDRLCFSVPLGQVVGPLETDIGYHLLLVSERTNCPNLDGEKTTLMQMHGDDVFGTLFEGEQVGRVNWPRMIVNQSYLCLALLFAGGFAAELSAMTSTGYVDPIAIALASPSY